MSDNFVKVVEEGGLRAVVAAVTGYPRHPLTPLLLGMLNGERVMKCNVGGFSVCFLATDAEYEFMVKMAGGYVTGKREGGHVEVPWSSARYARAHVAWLITRTPGEGRDESGGKCDGE